MKELLEKLHKAFPTTLVSIDTEYKWYSTTAQPIALVRFYIGALSNDRDSFFSEQMPYDDLPLAIDSYIANTCTPSTSSTAVSSSTIPLSNVSLPVPAQPNTTSAQSGKVQTSVLL